MTSPPDPPPTARETSRPAAASTQSPSPAPEAAAPPTAAGRRRPAPPAVNATRPPRWLERLELGVLRVLLVFLAPLGARGRSNLSGALSRFIGPWTPLARRISDNLDRVRPETPPDERRRIVRGVFDNFSRSVTEYLDLEALAARSEEFTVEGLEHLDAAREAAGGRVVVASAHFGNWEAIRAVAARRGAPMAIIYRAFNNTRFDDFFHKQIAATGWPAFRKGRVGGRALFEHVRGGGAAMILVDQRAGGAPLLSFLGRPAETSLAAAQLARSLKAPLLPAVAFRRPDGFEVRFEPPIPHGPPNEMMQAVNDRIEAWVDEDPAQWFWLHRRWKVRGQIDARRPSAARRYTR